MTVRGDLGMLREKHEAELRELVSQAIRAGAPTRELARVLGISRATVWRRFREELGAAAQQTGVTSTAFGAHPIEGGISPSVDEANNAQRRVDHGPRVRGAPATDGGEPGARVPLLDARSTMVGARAAQRQGVRASGRASQLTRAIAIELGNAARLTAASPVGVGQSC